jgi:hypothetical protein
VRSSEVGVVVVAPKRGDLEELPVAPYADGPEPVLVDRTREQVEESFGAGVRGEVPVGGRSSERQVAKRAADDVGRLARLPEVPQQGVNRVRDRALRKRSLERRQLRPRKR